MKEHTLNINDWAVSQNATVYTCYGLGSCVGLFLADKRLGLHGGAHIPLPTRSTMGFFKDANSLIQILLHEFESLGSDLNYLRAKITGGAQVYESSTNIGAQNSDVILQALIDKKIYIAAKDLGGNMSRTARFNSLTSELQISTSKLKSYII